METPSERSIAPSESASVIPREAIASNAKLFSSTSARLSTRANPGANSAKNAITAINAPTSAKRCKRPICSIMSVIPHMAAHKRGGGDDEQDQCTFHTVDPIARHVIELKAVTDDADEEDSGQCAGDGRHEPPRKYDAE